MNCVLYDGINNYDSNKDVRNAIEVVKRTSLGDLLTDFSKYSAGYIFSNENLSSYYPHFKIDGGSVLSVCGSGDQVLMAILNGASVVDCFDINKLAFYILMLKVYSIKYLDYDSFIYFFNISSRTGNRKRIFDNLCGLCKSDIISGNLSSSQVDVMNVVMCFWSSFFNDYSVIFNDRLSNSFYNSDGNDFFPYLFKKRDESIDESAKRISYLNKEEFLKLKLKIDNCEIRFINKDFEQVFGFFDYSYDFINLSNIFDYANPNEFVQFIKDARNCHLTNNGSIMVNYSWSAPGSVDKINEVSAKIGAEQHIIPDISFEGKNSQGSFMSCHR